MAQMMVAQHEMKALDVGQREESPAAMAVGKEESPAAREESPSGDGGRTRGITSGQQSSTQSYSTVDSFASAPPERLLRRWTMRRTTGAIANEINCK